MVQAGNVVTGEMVEELVLSGADIIKVGIGPGMYVCVCERERERGKVLWAYNIVYKAVYGPQLERSWCVIVRPAMTYTGIPL